MAFAWLVSAYIFFPTRWGTNGTNLGPAANFITQNPMHPTCHQTSHSQLPAPAATMAATTNPLHATHAPSAPSISSETHTIGGILVTIHGLAELPPSTTSVACLWLLHPRLQTKETMAPLAAQVLHAWNARPRPRNAPPRGLIAASFDQRNHGTRLVDALHNEAWRQGNPRHAQDMFSCLHGTATDTSQLLDHLESYLFVRAPRTPHIDTHLVLGVSLGGHAAWHCLLADPRISAAVVGIGCPDYARLMADRARLSKRQSYTESVPPGVSFLGSPDFPAALCDAVSRYDPAGLFLPGYFQPGQADAVLDAQALERMRRLVRERLNGKRILNLSGGADKLVPYAAGEPFLRVLKRVLAEDKTLDVRLEDDIFDGVGHAFSPAMAQRATEWVCEVLEEEDGAVVSKI